MTDMTIEELNKKLKRIKKKKKGVPHQAKRELKAGLITEIKKIVEKFPQTSVDEAEKEVRDKWAGYGEFVPRDWVKVLDILIEREPERRLIEAKKRRKAASVLDNYVDEVEVFKTVSQHLSTDKLRPYTHLSTLEKPRAGGRTKTKKKKKKTKKPKTKKPKTKKPSKKKK